ncbi:hypothetical protein ACKLNR_002726 [Fusarium oxysporum f. sp. zingiberi]
MKTTTMLIIAAFAGSALSLEVKDASTPGGGTPGSPACLRQCLITISPVDGASTQRSDGFPGSCKEYATGQLKGINRSVDGGRLNINGVGGNLVIDFVKNGRDRRASFTNCFLEFSPVLKISRWWEQSQIIKFNPSILVSGSALN